MTNTETDKRPKTTGRTILSRIIAFLITIAFIVLLTANLQLILSGNREFPPIAYATVSALFLIADSVRAGISMALAGLPIHAEQSSDD